ncbi:MAG: DMT family transporter [Alphaproteobacteria bacterium]
MVTKTDNYSLAIILLLGTLLLFTILDSIGKYLIINGIPVYQVVFIRYVVHVLLMLILFYPKMGRALFQCQSGWWVIIRSLLLTLMTLLNFWALSYIPIATTAAIIMTIPVFICFLSVLMLKERVGWVRISAMVAGFIGVLIILRPFGMSFHWAMLLSLGMAICGGLFNVITRKIAGVDSPNSLQFYGGIIGVILLLPFQFQGWVMPDNDLMIMLLIGLGFAGWGGHQLLILAHHHAEASSLAPIGYVQFLFMSISSWLIFQEVPDWPVFLGAAIILMSGLFIWWRERNLPAIDTESPATLPPKL